MDADIQLELVKLVNGERRLRLSHALSGLCLEKRLEPESPVASQKERWLRVFTALIERELAPA